MRCRFAAGRGLIERRRIEWLVGAFGVRKEARSCFESLGVAIPAFGLGLTELGQVFFAAAMQARFLKLQIPELPFVSQVRFELDQ